MYFCMSAAGGLEPATLRLVTLRSNPLRHGSGWFQSPTRYLLYPAASAS